MSEAAEQVNKHHGLHALGLLCRERQDTPAEPRLTGTAPVLCSSSGWGSGWGLPVISRLLLRPSRATLGPALVFVPMWRPSQEGQTHVRSPINPAGVAHYNVPLQDSASLSLRGLLRP